MLIPRINQCQDCSSLKQLLKEIDCSLQNFLRNKLNNENYNVETYYCSDSVRALAQYKRVLNRKIYNPQYLCGIDSQDIIFQVRKILFGTCGTCITCEEDSTTSSTTIINTTTFIPGISTTTSTTSTTVI